MPGRRTRRRQDRGPAAVMAALVLALVLAPFGCAGHKQAVYPLTAADAAWQQANDAGKIAFEQGRYQEAGRLFNDAIKQAEHFRPGDARLATSLNNLSAVYRARHRYAEAEPLDRRALAIQERALGANHLYVATTLANLAESAREQGRYEEAESLAKRSLALRERALGPDRPEVAAALNNLALVYAAQGRYADAEPLYGRALKIDEKAFGPRSAQVAAVLDNYAALLRRSPRAAEAAPLEARARAIRAELGRGDRNETRGSPRAAVGRSPG